MSPSFHSSWSYLIVPKAKAVRLNGYLLFNRNAKTFTFWLEYSLVVIFYFSEEIWRFLDHSDNSPFFTDHISWSPAAFCLGRARYLIVSFHPKILDLTFHPSFCYLLLCNINFIWYGSLFSIIRHYFLPATLWCKLFRPSFIICFSFMLYFLL